MKPMAIVDIKLGNSSFKSHVWKPTDDEKGTGFSMVHEDCGSKMNQVYVCRACDVEAKPVKGMGIDGELVTLSDEEYKAFNDSLGTRIKLTDFTNEVPEPERINQVYWLTPLPENKKFTKADAEASQKNYGFITTLLERENRLGVGMFSYRGATNPCRLQAKAGRLYILKLVYAEYMRELPAFELPEVSVPDSITLDKFISGSIIEPTDERAERMIAYMTNKTTEEAIELPATGLLAELAA